MIPPIVIDMSKNHPMWIVYSGGELASRNEVDSRTEIYSHIGSTTEMKNLALTFVSIANANSVKHQIMLPDDGTICVRLYNKQNSVLIIDVFENLVVDLTYETGVGHDYSEELYLEELESQDALSKVTQYLAKWNLSESSTRNCTIGILKDGIPESLETHETAVFQSSIDSAQNQTRIHFVNT